MSNIRIEKIRLHNFKGVYDMEFSMDGTSATILGGKNGFGKTTIFDAIELVLTGKIARYNDYEESFIDRRRAYSQVERPLVCNENVPEVRIDLHLSIILNDGQALRRILTRETRTAELRYPMRFEPFKDLKIRENEQDDPRNATQEELDGLGLTAFGKHYATLNYMSQEESTKFIKSKDTERVDVVKFLFNTQQFDRRINKIDKVLLKALRAKTEAATQQKQQKVGVVQALRQFGMGEAGELPGYQRLFNDEVQVEWDAEQPTMSNEDYARLLQEGGLLDEIQSFVTHQDDFRKWRNNRFLAGLMEQSSDYAFYLQYQSKEQGIALWKVYQREMVEPFSRLDLQHITGYQFIVNERLRNLAGEERIEGVLQLLQQVKYEYKAATDVQRAYNELLEQRNRLATHLREHAEQLQIKRCPLCGQSYETIRQLLDSVETTLQLQISSFTAINDQVAKDYALLSERISEIIEILNTRFKERDITPETVARYEGIDKEKISANIQKLRERGFFSGLPTLTLAETENALHEELQRGIQAHDENIDYNSLNTIYANYVRYIPKELRTVDAIQQKRAYLLQSWDKRKSHQMEKLTKEVAALDTLLGKYGTLESQLRQVKETIISQRDTYLKKVVTDVEILFYVYSGRIMQDSFYGRGLFMKNEPGKYIYFVSKYASDFDALYKMSSGQLVALMMALLLSLNKLYSESKFLAIDDPVQTIDDINVWGFVETVRHEFREHQLIFSTHELSYGSFLRYKLSNMKIKARYVDMMELRKRPETIPEE